MFVLAPHFKTKNIIAIQLESRQFYLSVFVRLVFVVQPHAIYTNSCPIVKYSLLTKVYQSTTQAYTQSYKKEKIITSREDNHIKHKNDTGTIQRTQFNRHNLTDTLHHLTDKLHTILNSNKITRNVVFHFLKPASSNFYRNYINILTNNFY